jgi:peptidoglycan/LPS O-acetylase OafA/YrhL
VDLFFTISGFLIGGHIYAEVREDRFSFVQFYYRRAKRILPALFVTLVGVLGLGLLLLSPAEMTILGRDSFATALSVSNIIFWKKDQYFSPSSHLNPLLMTWSLGVEEQFYFTIPVLLVVLARLRKSLIAPLMGAICCVSFALSWFLLPILPSAVF